MTDNRIEGASRQFSGKLQDGLGRLSGDGRTQLNGKIEQAKGTALNYFGKAVDALESRIDQVPAGVRPQARQAVQVARDRPFVTMLGLAAVGLLLANASGKRRR